MIYALDTNIISYVLNGNADLAEKLNAVTQSESKVIIPLMVYYEVRRGLLANGATAKTRLFDNLCTRLGIHNLTKADMNTAAAIYADRKRKGAPIDDSDLLIAAQCSANGYTLVTHNTKHFEGIGGLTIVDWYNK
ncbi:MAG: PIN domain-containing protein [Oscillospiraceae bacterium]|nr:PIN domain-containing protein [Oscillospiraceae bacterium]